MARLPQNLTAPIDRLARQAIGRDWQLYSILLQNWLEIIGAEWAGQVMPVRLAFPAAGERRQGVLTVSLPRGLTMAAQYAQPQILARINGFLGHDAVTRLHFVHAIKAAKTARVLPSLPEAKQSAIAAATAGIAHEELRQALADFGAAMAQDLAAQAAPE